MIISFHLCELDGESQIKEKLNKILKPKWSKTLTQVKFLGCIVQDLRYKVWINNSNYVAMNNENICSTNKGA
jgi:hypothetical protein